MLTVKSRISLVADTELEESDEAAADHASQATRNSASAEVLSAEVRVLHVGNLQLTRSMYRQLDEAAPERFEPFGRVKDNERILKDGVLLVSRDSKTGALVRYHAQPPDWSESEGPEEFAHWMRHWVQLNGSFITYHLGYPVARYQGLEPQGASSSSAPAGRRPAIDTARTALACQV
jgi:hypothetical protein